MARLLPRVFACLISTLVACSAPQPSAGPAKTAAPAAPQPSTNPAKTAAPQPAPDAKPDENGWGVAAGLRYLEIVRGDAKPEDELPLLLVIHGLGDKPSRDWLSAIDLDPLLKARMILPQAPIPHGPGFSWFTYRFGDWDDPELAAGISMAVSGLARTIEQLTRMRPTRGRVIVCGFSQGGMLSFALALAHPELVQRAVPISGTLPRPLWPETKSRGWLPRITALHGTADALVPFDGDTKLVQHLRALRFPAELEVYEGVEHRISPAMSARVRAELSAAVAELAAQPTRH